MHNEEKLGEELTSPYKKHILNTFDDIIKKCRF